MKERGIIFTAESVRAILNGRKTVTRRLVKYNAYCGEPGEWCPDIGRLGTLLGDYTRWCKQGQVGGLLYVKEAFSTVGHGRDFGIRIRYEANPERADHVVLDPAPNREDRWRPTDWKGRSPLFMPRWCSRINLKIVNVRVERLQDITEQDAIAEGVHTGDIPADDYGPRRIGYVFGADDGKCLLYPTARNAFAIGWDHINGKKATWAQNPWIWRIEFKRVP